MKKQNHCYLGYESPELLYLSYEGEGLLCQSFGTNEGDDNPNGKTQMLTVVTY